MRILVLGGTGLIGNRLTRQLRQNADVYASTRSSLVEMPVLENILEPNKWIFGLDATDFQFLESEINRLKPDVVVNCFGVVKHQINSKSAEATILLNSILPWRLSELAEKYDFKLIHLSTDCVFSGETGNYKESSTPDALDLYGRSKILGELNNARDLTLRTSFVGREIKTFANFFEWVQRSHNTKIVGYKRAIYSGLTTQAISEIIEKLIFDFSGLTGLWHVSSEPISKYDLICMLNHSLNLKLDIEPNEEFCCDRSLDSTAFASMTSLVIPNWITMLERYVLEQEWYESILRNKVGAK